MSRGRGRVMVALLGALRAASGPLAFNEVAIGMNGSKTVTRFRRGRPRRVVVPAGDTASLRRALRGLVRRGDVVVIVDDVFPKSARRPDATRYAVSDRCTGNVDASANEVTCPSLPPKPASDLSTDVTTSSGARGATRRLVHGQREANRPGDRRTGSPGPAHLIRAVTGGPRRENDLQHLDEEFARTDSSPASLTAADRRFLDFLARTALRIVTEEAKLAMSSGETEPSKEQ